MCCCVDVNCRHHGSQHQTISGLACGHTIKGKVAFLGGPLSFLSELRKRFIETLELKDDEIIFPENSKYFVAIGAAMKAAKSDEISFAEILQKAEHADPAQLNRIPLSSP